MTDETVGELAELYLGNILYAIELAALTLQQQGKQEDAGFYRAIARKLAEAHGRRRAREAGADPRDDQPRGDESRGDQSRGDQPRGAAGA